MAHPFAEHRQTKKEHSRVGHITKRYASGGAVNRTEDDRKVRKMSASQGREVDPEGGVSPHRMDRPTRAKGGKVKSKGNSRTIVNVITGGHPAGGAVPAMPPMPPAPGIAGAALPAPPMGAKPPMPMPMPMRAKGGKVKHRDDGGAVKEQKTKDLMDQYAASREGRPPARQILEERGLVTPSRAKGGRVNQGSPVYEAGKRAGTQISHDDGHSDLSDMNRKKVITFRSGGRVRRFEASDKVAKATMLPGGASGGEARLVKAHRAARKG